VLAFVIAALMAWVELVTSKYPRTGNFVAQSWPIYAFAAIYGLIAFGSRAGLDYLVTNGFVKIEGIALADPWIQSVIVGLSTKAFMHIRLFSVTAGSLSIPIGVETIVLIFEPWLLDEIDLDEFLTVRKFVQQRAAHHPNLANVRNLVAANLPRQDSKARDAFLLDIQNSASVVEAMELYIHKVGRRIFSTVFD